MSTKKQKVCELIWYLGIFTFMYVWFTRIHPLVVYDADDWTYSYMVRQAVPMWGAWNPSRVFPEIFMPFCSSVAVYFLMPLTGDYIGALTAVHALVVSGFITVYVYCFGQLIKRVFSLSALCTGFASALFLVLHFLVFRNDSWDNLYMFHCVNVTCYYYYLIPALMNASLVMWMTKNPKFDDFMAKGSLAVKGIFVLVLYLAIFSNLPASGILAVYAGSVALMDFVKRLQGKFRLKEFVRSNAFYIGILAAWLVSAVLELFGQRAVSVMTQDLPLLYAIKEAAYIFVVEMLLRCNRTFLALSIGIVILAAILFAVSRRKETVDQDFLCLAVGAILCAAVMLVYTLILCAKVELSYMYRNEYLFGVFFYGLMIVLLGYAYVIRKQPRVLLVVPILLCILVWETNTNGRTFARSNMSDLDPHLCAQISNDLVSQAVEADQAGQTEMTLYVPVWESEDNWPHAVQLMERLSMALYEHGLISKPMGMAIEPSEAINEKYNLPIPENK